MTTDIQNNKEQEKDIYTIIKELDPPLQKLAKKYENKSFAIDGIINPDAWEKQKTPKVCFLLKEAYRETPKKEPWDLRAYVQGKEIKGMWHKVASWTQAILMSINNDNNFYYKEVTDKKDLLKRIAVVNIKKSNGKKESDNDDLDKYVDKDSDLIFKQIELINPDIIICGNTYSLLEDRWPGNMKKSSQDDWVYLWNHNNIKNTIVLNYYHPSSRMSKKMHYYTIASLCRIGLDFKEQEECKTNHTSIT